MIAKIKNESYPAIVRNLKMCNQIQWYFKIYSRLYSSINTNTLRDKFSLRITMAYSDPTDWYFRVKYNLFWIVFWCDPKNASVEVPENIYVISRWQLRVLHSFFNLTEGSSFSTFKRLQPRVQWGIPSGYKWRALTKSILYNY